jgi:sulfite reductase (NADPH) flavoprotein alpha-component
MLKRLIRPVHRWLGLTIGLVLAVMGLTGATMAFEDPIKAALSPGIVDVAPQPGPPLSPDALIAAFTAQRPGMVPSVLTLTPRPGASAGVTFKAKAAPASAGEAANDHVYLDPYSGRVLGHAHLEVFFAKARLLHRFLLLPPVIGHQITGVAALFLIFFAISGLYLRWPRRALNLKTWLKPELKYPGRARYYSLHQVTGTWLCLVYLIIAPVGLTWAYDCYKAGFTRLLAGASISPAEDAPAAKGPAGPISLDAAWRTFQAEVPEGASSVLMTIPKKPGAPVLIRYLAPDPPSDYAYSALTVDGTTGAMISHIRYDDLPLGARIVTAKLAVHRGSFFGLPGAILFMIAAATLPLFPITGYLLYRDRRAKKAAAARKRMAQDVAA